MTWNGIILRLACALAIGSAFGCASDGSDGTDGTSGTDSLVSIDMVAAGSDCAAGGIRINSGADVDGNGTLDAGEVTASEIVCTGETPTQALIATTDLAQGDSNCPGGGVQIDVGLDDDGNGTLDAAEVDDTTYSCVSSPNLFVGSMDEPAGDAGTSVIDASGGDATMGAGGDGEDVQIYFDYGSLGGHLKIFTTGSTDASFTTPAVTANLGANPLNVTSDLTPTMVVAGDTSGLTAGEIFQNDGGRTLYEFVSMVARPREITGVEVAAGATLTLPRHPGGATAGLNLDNDLSVLGTITVERAAMSNAGSDVRLDAALIVTAADSLIDVSGADGAALEDGGDGGDLDIDASTDESGTMVLAGSIDTSGGDGVNGGSGGNISASAYIRLYQNGTLTTDGGAGATADGGSAGSIDLYTEYGPVHNSGALSAVGGAAAAGSSGGSGGDIDIYTDELGDVYNSGELTARGGQGGGSGGDVEMYAYGGGVWNNAMIDASGGDNAMGSGGGGGSIEIYNEYANDPWDTEYVAAGDINVSGDLVTRGGNGNDGGDAGEVDIYLDAEYVATGQELILYGYAMINTSGGDGVTSGGSGGDVDLDQEYADIDFPSEYGPGGAILLFADVDATGGAASNGGGGAGGDFDADTEDYYGTLVDFEVVRVYGDLDLSGGDGTTSGGGGGDLDIYAFNGADIIGTVTLDGGAASATSGNGSGAGDFDIACDVGYVNVTGDVSAVGGDGTGSMGDGGGGGDSLVFAAEITVSGALTFDGGAGNATDGFGGDGGDVELTSVRSTLANVTGAISVAGGAGMTSGGAGTVLIDGVTQP